MNRDFRGLKAYKQSRVLVRSIYRATDGLSPRETYGLSAQMRRASLSVVANLAEGYGRVTPAARAGFLRISIGSLNEIEGFLDVCGDLELFDTQVLKEIRELRSEVDRLFFGLLRYTLDQTRTADSDS